MKAFGYVFSLVVLGVACGQVQEKEVKLEMLPEGETNAAYTSTQTTTPTEETDEATEETSTETLTGLAAAIAEMDSRSTESCTSGLFSDPTQHCAFTTAHEVTNAIVTASRPCSTVTGSQCTGVTSGPLWIMVQDADGVGAYLRVYGNRGGISSDVTVGSKVSFKVSRFTKNAGMMQITAVTDFTSTTATLSDSFKLASQVLDLTQIKTSDFSTSKSEGLWRMMTGVVQITDGSASGTQSFPATNLAGATFKVRASKSSDNIATNSCYKLENVMFTRFNSDTFLVDITASAAGGGFEYRTYGIGTFTKVTCSEYGY